MTYYPLISGIASTYTKVLTTTDATEILTAVDTTQVVGVFVQELLGGTPAFTLTVTNGATTWTVFKATLTTNGNTSHYFPIILKRGEILKATAGTANALTVQATFLQASRSSG